MPTTKPRHVSTLVLPLDMAKHVRTQATRRGMTQAAFIRHLIFEHMEATQAAGKATQAA